MDKRQFNIFCEILFLCLCIANQVEWIDAKRPKSWREKPVVKTAVGKVRGRVLETRLGEPFYAFRGMPYAQSPINKLRFKAPRPITQKWSGVLDATEDGPMCIQSLKLKHCSRLCNTTEPYMCEDCLRVNVYTRELPPMKRLKPVLVFIHAGQFLGLSGQSHNYAGPQHLMDRDIVLVTFNYRLGTLGFLSTGTKHAPGNNGLKDQVALLHWVQKNIMRFGGDPRSVTLVGYGAGAISVTLHMVSPMSVGLFHKVIVMSGSATSQWKVPQSQRKLAIRHAKLLKCPIDDVGEMMKCLKKVNVRKISKTQGKLFEIGDFAPVLLWKPVIEKDFGQQRFLTDHPTKLFERGEFADVPVLTGITANGKIGPAVTILGNKTHRHQLNDDFDDFAPIYFLYERDSERSKEISTVLRHHYLPGPIKKRRSFEDLKDLFADSLIGFGVYRFAKLVTHFKCIYFYVYCYNGRYSCEHYPGDKPYGAVFNDDLQNLIVSPCVGPPIRENDPESIIIERMTRLWANFALKGNPNDRHDDYVGDISWWPMSKRRFNYLDMNDEFVTRRDVFTDRYRLWNQLFPIKKSRNW